MATLHVRNIPDRMHRRIAKIASAQGRSISAEVVNLLDRALALEEQRLQQKSLLDGIRRRRESRKRLPGTPDSLTLLREDRAR
jgi:plasmid stability protein